MIILKILEGNENMYYYVPYRYPPNYVSIPMYFDGVQPVYWMNYNAGNRIGIFQPSMKSEYFKLKDYGPEPYVININKAAKQNNTFRTAIWTGNHLQVTLMSIHVGEDIGWEIHHDLDQFLRVEQGQGIVRMGKSQENINYERKIKDDSAIMIPAGTWHNVFNTGNVPLKLYSIYAPPQHPHGTIHLTKADAEMEKRDI